MNTRIRYVRNPDGSLTSGQILRGAYESEYRVSIHQDGNTGYIHSIKGHCVAVVNATSPHKVKIKLKKELEKFGVVFEEEKRKERK
jgi:hypothetical protein